MRPYFKIRPFSAAGMSYTSVQVASVYNFPNTGGAGKTIGIIELGGGYKMQDLQAYFSELKIPVPNIVSVSVDGAKNSPGSDSDVEVVLDIEVAAAVAPKANYRVYFAQNTNNSFINAVRTAVNDGVDAISISWGAPENQWDMTSMQTMNNVFQLAQQKGINVFVASGDNGSSDGESGNNVDFPASSPYVIACGGTTLQASTRRISESAWSNGGGGYSKIFTMHGKPRGVPDMAGNADPSTGYNIIVNGQMQVVGGTSAVAPLFAALSVLLGAKNLYSIAYNNSNCFFDIVEGSNGSYAAKVGWDAVTGLGVPNGQQLLNAITPPPAPQPPLPPVPPTPTPTPQPPVPPKPPKPQPNPIYIKIIETLIAELGNPFVSIIISILNNAPLPKDVSVSPSNYLLIKTLVQEFGPNLVEIVTKMLPTPVPATTKLVRDILILLQTETQGQLVDIVSKMLSGNPPTNMEPIMAFILNQLVKDYGTDLVKIISDLPPSIITGQT